MKNIFKISLALPMALLLGACNDDVKKPSAKEGSYDVAMTMLVDQTRAVSTVAGSEAENAYNTNRLYFGTYDADGNKIHSLYEGGECNKEVSAFYYHPNWGPTVSAKLPRDKYEGRVFYTGIFSVPKKMSFESFSLRGLGDKTTNVLNWPGVKSADYVWTPSTASVANDMDDHIPMAGVKKIETSLMDKYNNDINQYSPFRLPDVVMTRAMAKIIIEDVDGIIESVTLATPEKGTLVPYLPALLDASKAMQPVEPEGGKGNLLPQKRTTPSETVNGVKRYIFYSFEWSMLEYEADGKTVKGIKGVNHDDRKIITLKANAKSGLQGSTRETTTVSFAPHSALLPGTTGNLSTVDGGAWQGVMRNTVYTFRIFKPSVGGVHVDAVATPWVKHTGTFDF